MITSRKHTIFEYIASKIEKDIETRCWNWIGVKDKDGYGRACYDNKRQRAHRMTFSAYKHNNIKNKLICHTCDNPSCVNPEHLFLGTPLDNMQDKVQKGKQRVGEKLPWAKLTEQDVIKMRELRKTNTLENLSKLFNISISTVSDICNYKIWKHI